MQAQAGTDMSIFKSTNIDQFIIKFKIQICKKRKLKRHTVNTLLSALIQSAQVDTTLQNSKQTTYALTTIRGTDTRTASSQSLANATSARHL